MCVCLYIIIYVFVRKTSVHGLVGLVNPNQILVSVNIRCKVEISVIGVYILFLSLL